MKIFTLITTTLLSASAFCQTYTFSSFPGGYTDLVAPTSLNNGQIWDDPIYDIPLGFTFDYFEDPITSIRLDGLGSLMISGDCAFDPNEAYLVPYGTDIIDRGYDGAASLSNISYKTEGTAGSRICKIEWKNVGFYSGSTDANGDRIDYLNFQLWLFETTNVIEVHFGPKSITEPAIDFEGETGSFVLLADNIDCSSGNVLGHQLMMSGSPANPDFFDNVYSIEDTLLFLNGVIPPFTVYRFNPAPTASQDELSSTPSFSVVPNPADHKIRFFQQGAALKMSNLSIVDMSGKVLLTNLDFNTEISIDDLQSGMYFVRMQMETGECYSEKFSKR